jgi:hypothetical protein
MSLRKASCVAPDLSNTGATWEPSFSEFRSAMKMLLSSLEEIESVLTLGFATIFTSLAIACAVQEKMNPAAAMSILDWIILFLMV